VLPREKKRRKMVKRYLKKKAEIPPLPEIEEPQWSELVRELIVRGFSKMALAHRCELSRETLQSIMLGRTDPRWYSGQKLLQIHKIVVQKDITSERIQNG
jgi:hypothetical protein